MMNKDERNARRRFLREQKRLENARIAEELWNKHFNTKMMNKKLTFNSIINMHELDLKIVFKKGIEQLKPKEQIVIVRRFYQNQPYVSIAEEMGLSLTRIKQIEKMALSRFNHRLQSNLM